MRTRRRVTLRIGAAGCLLAAGLLWWATSAGAENTEPRAGWWYRYSGGEGEPTGSGSPGEPSRPPQTTPPPPVPFPTGPALPDDVPAAPVPAPPPAAVPEGGMYIANDVFGPAAIGAVRFTVGQVGEAQLTLQFGSGGAGAGGLPIMACPLLEGFEAVSNGAWRDRPAHDCDRAAARGTIASDGTMSFTLSADFQTGATDVLDLVILPEPANGTPFSATFQAPRADSLDVFSGAPEDRVDAGAADDGFSLKPTGSLASSSGGTARPPSSSAGGRLPAAPQPEAGLQSHEGATGGGDDVGSGAGDGSRVADLREPWKYARPVATALLVALALALAAVSSDRVRTAVPALARFGGPIHDGPQERGVGRFARSRGGLPPTLS